jgi:hypothetical protein
VFHLPRSVVLLSGLVALTSACGGPAAKSSGDGTPSASPVVEKPLTFYAAQYQSLSAPCLQAHHTLNTSKTKAEVLANAKGASVACQASDAALLRANWPVKVLAIIKAAVAADGPILRDLADPENHRADLPRDYASANAAANSLRAGLGLPPTN